MDQFPAKFLLKAADVIAYPLSEFTDKNISISRRM